MSLPHSPVKGLCEGVCKNTKSSNYLVCFNAIIASFGTMRRKEPAIVPLTCKFQRAHSKLPVVIIGNSLMQRHHRKPSVPGVFVTFLSNNIDVDPQQHFFPKMSSRQSGATRDLKKSIVEISQSLCFFDMTSTKQFLGQLLYYCSFLSDKK